MRAKTDSEKKFAEQKLARFLDVQTAVFLNYDHLLEWCKRSFAGDNDQASYELAKRIFKDVVGFERVFDEFEVEFWNYIGDIDDARARIGHHVIREGLADHKEYFFGKIETCVSRLGEVITEARAQGYEWDFVEQLESSLEGLYDICEDLIEADLATFRGDDIAELLRQIPPQRLAPLEVFSTADSIRKKADTHLQTMFTKSACEMPQRR